MDERSRSRGAHDRAFAQSGGLLLQGEDANGTVDLGEHRGVPRVGFGAAWLTGPGTYGPPPDLEVARSLVRHGQARLDALETVGLASAGGHLDHDLGTAELRVELAVLSPLSEGQREADRSHTHSNNTNDKSGIHPDGLPDLVAAKLAASDLPPWVEYDSVRRKRPSQAVAM